MPTNLKERIFGMFFTLFDKVQDANKNAENKGTLERYCELIGEDLDNNLIPFIDNAHDNLIVPLTMLQRYIADREISLGNNVLFLGTDDPMRRRIIKHWHKYVQAKGTLTNYNAMFAMLGVTATINENLNAGGFDSPTTFDSDTRPTFDSGRCRPCTEYDIVLTGPPLSIEIYNAILSIVLFNEPINARLTDITYNGQSITNVVPNYFYKTSIIGQHSVAVDGATPTAFFEFGNGVYIPSNNPSYAYFNAGVKGVNVQILDPTTVTRLGFANQKLVGSIDLSIFTGATEFEFSGSPQLTSAPLPPAIVPTYFDFDGTAIPTFDFTLIPDIGGDIRLGNNAALTSLVFAAAQSTNPTSNINLDATGLVSIDLSQLLFANRANVSVSNSAALTNFDLSFNPILVQNRDVFIRNNPLLTSIDLSGQTVGFQRLDISDNPNLTSVTFAATSIFASLEARNLTSYNSNLDISTVGLAKTFDISGSAITKVTHAASNASVVLYSIANCTNITYYDITPMDQILIAIDDQFLANDCGLTQVDVDSFLADLVTIVTTRGAGAGTVNLGGTNAAPSAAGLADKATLQGFGITVITN